MSEQIFFNGWGGPARILMIAPLAYVVLVLFLRISGKRTLSKLNAFDLVVTVALGSTLATQILSKDTPIADGALAFALLVGLQWVVTKLSMQSANFRRIVRADPSVLLRDGRLQHDVMLKERITEGEILQAVRSQGGNDLSQALAVYLESDGSLSTILRS